MPKAPLKVYLSDTFDPWFNLATEDWIFREMDPEQQVLFLWRNSETVVIGRFQNPWTECNTSLMEKDGVKLARRQSGGGAVFHDLGNTNFTFMSSKESYDKSRNNQIITNALKKFGVEAYPSGRNDILIDDKEGAKKISGSAFKEAKDRSFHHGTLLIDADLSKLGNYLNPHKKKLVSKGISSVRSRVANLVQVAPELKHEILCAEIVKEFHATYAQECPVEMLNYESLKEIPVLNSYYEKLKDWKWRFGETPKFNHQMHERFDWGSMEVHLDSHKGLIEEVKIFSDSLHPEMIEYLTQALKGQNYDAQGVEKACLHVQKELPMISNEIVEFQSWLSQQIQG